MMLKKREAAAESGLVGKANQKIPVNVGADTGVFVVQ